MQSLVTEMFERLLASSCSPALIRAAEAGIADERLAALWEAITSAGFPDAMVAEANGGFGLSLADVLPLCGLIGRHLLPFPLAETMVARSLIDAAGMVPPSGPIVLATGIAEPDGRVIATGFVPLACTANFALVKLADSLHLLPVVAATATIIGGAAPNLAARLSWDAAIPHQIIPATNAPLRELAAVLHAAKIAGAMQKLLTMTVDYANTRSQFGRVIGKFQAVQQQASVMAELVMAAQVAVDSAGNETGLWPDHLRAAVAKERASAAVAVVAAMAHAIHGAIGISAEHDLQLYTRRLHEWRVAEGAESFWAARIGRVFLAADDKTAVDFIRTRLAA